MIEIEINTIEDFLNFIKDNWHNLNDEDFNKLLFSFFNCYAFGKPENLELAIEQILKHNAIIKRGFEKPLFFMTELDINFDIKNVFTENSKCHIFKKQKRAE